MKAADDMPSHPPKRSLTGASLHEELEMIRRPILIATLLFLFTPLAFAGEPEINVKAVCNARLSDAKSLQVPPDQSDADQW